MQSIILRVLQGADRGRVFNDLRPPITIGREEGNVVQLNDERISRYHVKIQEDDGRLVVTDLESTNGTKVNGSACNLKILQYGDTIAIGRTILLVGNRNLPIGTVSADGDSSSSDGDESGSTRIHAVTSGSGRRLAVYPRGLSPGQSAELRELLDFIHSGAQAVIEHGVLDEKLGVVNINSQAWQKMLVIQSQVAELIRNIEVPPHDDAFDTGPD